MKVQIGSHVFESNVDELSKIFHVLINGQNACLADAHELHVKAKKAEEDGETLEHNLCIEYADREEACYDVADKWKSALAFAMEASLKEGGIND